VSKVRTDAWGEDLPESDRRELYAFTKTPTDEERAADLAAAIGRYADAGIPVPAEWTGDVSAAYTDRYHYYFPGEPEAKGFTAPKSTWGGKGGKK